MCFQLGEGPSIMAVSMIVKPQSLLRYVGFQHPALVISNQSDGAGLYLGHRYETVTRQYFSTDEAVLL